MDCVIFSIQLLPDLTALINSHVVQMPPRWRLSEAQVATTLATSPGLWESHYPEAAKAFESETICVLDRGRLVAAAQWGCPARPDLRVDHPVNGSIFWVVAEPDDSVALQLLLEALVAQSRAVGCRELASARYAFGVGWLGIPTIWPHLTTGLQMAGAQVYSRWLTMTGPANTSKAEAPMCLEPMRVVWRVDEAALEWELRLCADDQLIGECHAWGIPRHLADCDGYADWITVEWLGVELPYRGRGIGRWLLYEQLRRQAQRGITHAILWAGTDNAAARRVGEALGFQEGPECWEFKIVK